MMCVKGTITGLVAMPRQAISASRIRSNVEKRLNSRLIFYSLLPDNQSGDILNQRLPGSVGTA